MRMPKKSPGTEASQASWMKAWQEHSSRFPRRKLLSKLPTRSLQEEATV